MLRDPGRLEMRGYRTARGAHARGAGRARRALTAPPASTPARTAP